MMKKSLSLLIGVSALICFSSPTWAMQCRDLLTNESKNVQEDFLNRQQVDDVVELALRPYVNARGVNGNTALILASRYGHADIVKWLLGHKDTKVNVRDKDGYTPLMWASRIVDTPI